VELFGSPSKMGECAAPVLPLLGPAHQVENEEILMRRSSCLSRGRCAWCDLRKDRSRGCNYYFQRRQGSNRLENRNAQGSFGLDGGLVAQMAVWAMSVVRGIRMMPVADDASSKNQ
jgi:hypothetical protein